MSNCQQGFVDNCRETLNSSAGEEDHRYEEVAEGNRGGSELTSELGWKLELKVEVAQVDSIGKKRQRQVDDYWDPSGLPMSGWRRGNCSSKLTIDATEEVLRFSEADTFKPCSGALAKTCPIEHRAKSSLFI